jgi:hypothetical protein
LAIEPIADRLPAPENFRHVRRDHKRDPVQDNEERRCRIMIGQQYQKGESSPGQIEDGEVRRLLALSRELLAAHGTPSGCEVSVSKRGRWFVLRGRVGCHATRAAIFGLVPEMEGARWIVDELRCGAVPCSGREV